jgi:hypothetical protein
LLPACNAPKNIAEKITPIGLKLASNATAIELYPIPKEKFSNSL